MCIHRLRKDIQLSAKRRVVELHEKAGSGRKLAEGGEGHACTVPA